MTYKPSICRHLFRSCYRCLLRIKKCQCGEEQHKDTYTNIHIPQWNQKFTQISLSFENMIVTCQVLKGGMCMAPQERKHGRIVESLSSQLHICSLTSSSLPEAAYDIVQQLGLQFANTRILTYILLTSYVNLGK